MRETGRSGVAAHLCKRVRAIEGGYIRKVKFEGRNGAPDYLVFLPGHKVLKKPFFVETKAPKKDPRINQSREIEKLERMGFKVFVPRSKEDVDSLIDTGQI